MIKDLVLPAFLLRQFIHQADLLSFLLVDRLMKGLNIAAGIQCHG